MHCLHRFILPAWMDRYRPSGALQFGTVHDGIKFAAVYADRLGACMPSNNNAAQVPEMPGG